MVLQQLDHQAALQRRQLAAVVLLQDGGEPAAEAPQARQRAAVRHVEQRVEELQPQVGVGVPEEEEEEETKSGGAEEEPRFSRRLRVYLLKTPFVLHLPPSLDTCMYVPNSMQ